MEKLDEITLYRFRVRSADGREAVSRIVADRKRPKMRLATAQETERWQAEENRKAAAVADEEVLPAEPPPEEMLANPRWSDESFAHGDQAVMMVDAPGLDGRTVRFLVERNQKGEWAKYDTV